MKHRKTKVTRMKSAAAHPFMVGNPLRTYWQYKHFVIAQCISVPSSPQLYTVCPDGRTPQFDIVCISILFSLHK